MLQSRPDTTASTVASREPTVAQIGATASAPPLIISQTPEFVRNSRNFLCCCTSCRCCCHVRYGIIALSIWELVFSAIGVAALLAIFFTAGGFEGLKTEDGTAIEYGGCAIGAIIAFVGFLVAIILTFVALRRDSPCLLVPHLIMQVLAILACLGIMIFAIVSFARIIAAGFGGVIIAIIIFLPFAAASCWQVWFFAVTVKCFRYLKEKRAAKNETELPAWKK